MDFVSKRLGKDIGITFNKEILMNGSNESIIAIKSALVDSKRGFTSDTHSSTNARLFDKAVRLRLLNPETCSISKRPKVKESSSNSDTESDHTSSKKSVKAKPKSNLKSSTVAKSSPAAKKPEANNTAEVEVSESAIEEPTKPTATTIINAWFPSNANELPQEPVHTILIPVFDHELESRKNRTITLISRLHQSVTEGTVLSVYVLNEIEKLVNIVEGAEYTSA
jgi:flagellar biosynthesis GTPase FlhF